MTQSTSFFTGSLDWHDQCVNAILFVNESVGLGDMIYLYGLLYLGHKHLF